MPTALPRTGGAPAINWGLVAVLGTWLTAVGLGLWLLQARASRR
jgi:hypothetical protein